MPEAEVVAQFVGQHRGGRVLHVGQAAVTDPRADRAQAVGTAGGAARDVEQKVLGRIAGPADGGGHLVPEREGAAAAGRRDDPIVAVGHRHGDRAVALLVPELADRAVDRGDDVGQLPGVARHAAGLDHDHGYAVGGRGRGGCGLRRADDLGSDYLAGGLQALLHGGLVPDLRPHRHLDGRARLDGGDVLGGDADRLTLGNVDPAQQSVSGVLGLVLHSRVDVFRVGPRLHQLADEDVTGLGRRLLRTQGRDGDQAQEHGTDGDDDGRSQGPGPRGGMHGGTPKSEGAPTASARAARN
jgi:hypothetical protein